MHIMIEPSDGRSSFTLCGVRPSVSDVAGYSVMNCSREFLRHVGICPVCIARYRYPPRVRLPFDCGKAGETRYV